MMSLEVGRINHQLIRRSSTPGTPRDNGNYASILSICALVKQIRSLMAKPFQGRHWIRFNPNCEAL